MTEKQEYRLIRVDGGALLIPREGDGPLLFGAFEVAGDGWVTFHQQMNPLSREGAYLLGAEMMKAGATLGGKTTHGD